MEALLEFLSSQPYAGIIMILTGFICSYIAGRSRVGGLYKKSIEIRVIFAVVTCFAYIFVTAGGIFIVIYNFRNPDLDTRDASVAGSFLLLGIAVVIIFLIRFFTYRFYRKKYLEEQRHKKMIEEINLIMAEFPEKQPDDLTQYLYQNGYIPDEPEPEFSKEDEEFLIYLQNKYLRKNEKTM